MLKSCKDQALASVTRLKGKMRERFVWSAVKLLTSNIGSSWHADLVPSDCRS